MNQQGQERQDQLAYTVCVLTNQADRRLNVMRVRQNEVIAFLVAVTPTASNQKVRLRLLRDHRLIQASPLQPLPMLDCPKSDPPLLFKTRKGA